MVQTSTKNIAKKAATIGGGLAAAFLPQYCSADIVTVGGDGGTGSTTLIPQDVSDLGGVLAADLYLYANSFSAALSGSGGDRLFSAYRSSNVVSAVNDPGSGTGPNDAINNWYFSYNGGGYAGSELNSADNWLPGVFGVNGVNNGDQIFGWLQVELGSAGNPTATIISFTYDDEATGVTQFAKPEGGFSVSSVPEPSGFAFLALLAAGAGGLGRYRRA